MGKRVFISSVTEGLRQERTALPGLIRALGMDPVRFEDFTALPEPSRDVCLQAVGTCDVYLLLLGEHYGTPFADTGLSPTHEEYRAAINKGIPRLAFRRRGVTMESAQAAFAAEVHLHEEPVRQRGNAMRRIDAGQVRLWEDTAVVAYAAYSGTGDTARIAPVYTPSPMRGRGYASALVARRRVGDRVHRDVGRRC